MSPYRWIQLIGAGTSVLWSLEMPFEEMSYGINMSTMKPFGLQRGIVGSTAKHLANSEYYKQQINRYEEDIAKLQADIEKAQEGKTQSFRGLVRGIWLKRKKNLRVGMSRLPNSKARLKPS